MCTRPNSVLRFSKICSVCIVTDQDGHVAGCSRGDFSEFLTQFQSFWKLAVPIGLKYHRHSLWNRPEVNMTLNFRYLSFWQHNISPPDFDSNSQSERPGSKCLVIDVPL